MEIINVLLLVIALLTIIVGYLIYIVQTLYKQVDQMEIKIYNHINTISESTIEVSTKVINESNDSLKTTIIEELTSIETKLNQEIKDHLTNIKGELNDAVKDDMKRLTDYAEAIKGLYDSLNSTPKPTKKTTKKNGI